VDQAVDAARRAQGWWSALGVERRFAALRRFARIATEREGEMAALIRDEVGKVGWDAMAEAKLLAAKVGLTLDGAATWSRVAGFEAGGSGTKSARCVFRPHGVAAVVGPFNFPAHLANGHMIPALALGNTVVFKPSDKAPGVGQMLGMWLDEAIRLEVGVDGGGGGGGGGVVNVVQGGAEVARRLVAHEGVDAVMFTGSWAVGRAILEANLDRPGRMVALEMGGNNAAVVLPDADAVQALTECARCAFITTGQRCTCTRRIIVSRRTWDGRDGGEFAERFVAGLCAAARGIVVGDPMDAGAFMGPLVSEGARAAVLAAQAAMARAGGTVLVEARAVAGRAGWFLTPGVVRVERFVGVGGWEAGGAGAGADEEVFGPLVRVCVVETAQEALAMANATRYGLAASVFTRDEAAAAAFVREARAGCVNVNTGTAGASGALPFGGLGLSGNHRPAGAFSVDYCGYPVATMEERGTGATGAVGLKIEW
jgi:succinylglutamic semialdehyde dehydrogenase